MCRVEKTIGENKTATHENDYKGQKYDHDLTHSNLLKKKGYFRLLERTLMQE